MATIIDDGSTWVDNEVYKIDATDPVEGASELASFGGLGVDNKPHQQLANRTSYLKTAIENLKQTFEIVYQTSNLLGGGLPNMVNGCFVIPFVDQTGTRIRLGVQWLVKTFTGVTHSGSAYIIEVSVGTYAYQLYNGFQRAAFAFAYPVSRLNDPGNKMSQIAWLPNQSTHSVNKFSFIPQSVDFSNMAIGIVSGGVVGFT
jgi:hypothetical protein